MPFVIGLLVNLQISSLKLKKEYGAFMQGSFEP